MSLLLLLKKTVPVLLRKMDRPFKVSVAKQKAFLASFPEPKDNIERSFDQYKCQVLFWGKWFHAFATLAATVLLPIQMLIVFRKKEPPAGERVGLLLLSEDMPDGIYPEILLDEHPCRKSVSFLDGLFLTRKDWHYFFSLVGRYPCSPYYLYKCFIKIAMYGYQINRHKPKAIAACGGEFTYTSSLLTDFCEKKGVRHYNAMHGEMFFYVLDSFCHFHRFYVWDDHYRELLKDLRASADEFIVSPPKTVVIDIQNVDTKGLEISDFKYYLQLQDEAHMRKIAAILRRLQEYGFTVCVRYHPRTTKVEEVYEIFRGIRIENPKDTNIKQSIKTAGHVMALNSTVLYQAYMSGVPVIIDDMTDAKKYERLGEMRYIMLSKKHTLLSDHIENKKFAVQKA